MACTDVQCLSQCFTHWAFMKYCEIPAWWQTVLFSLTADRADTNLEKYEHTWMVLKMVLLKTSTDTSWENIYCEFMLLETSRMVQSQGRWHERRAYNLHITLYRVSLVYGSMTQTTTDQSAIFERLSLKLRSRLWWCTAGYITFTPLLSHLF